MVIVDDNKASNSTGDRQTIYVGRYDKKVKISTCRSYSLKKKKDIKKCGNKTNKVSKGFSFSLVHEGFAK